MSDFCVCGHEEREHAIGNQFRSEYICCHDFGGPAECSCESYLRSPLSSFRGPAATFSREEAAGWLDALGRPVAAAIAAVSTHATIRREARDEAQNARWCARHSEPRRASEHYLAARILRTVRL